MIIKKFYDKTKIITNGDINNKLYKITCIAYNEIDINILKH